MRWRADALRVWTWTCCEWMRTCWRVDMDVLRADADEQKGKKEKKEKTYFSVDMLRADVLACVLRADADEQKGKKKEKKEKEKTYFNADMLRADALACGHGCVACECG